jgi:hypothetical protein
MTPEEVKVQELLRTNPQFRADTLSLLHRYRKSNWRSSRERRQFREEEQMFRNKWGCDFAVIAFHYHYICN